MPSRNRRPIRDDDEDREPDRRQVDEPQVRQDGPPERDVAADQQQPEHHEQVEQPLGDDHPHGPRERDAEPLTDQIGAI